MTGSLGPVASGIRVSHPESPAPLGLKNIYIYIRITQKSVHVCDYLSIYIYIYGCMCIYIYMYVCTCMHVLRDLRPYKLQATWELKTVSYRGLKKGDNTLGFEITLTPKPQA